MTDASRPEPASNKTPEPTPPVPDPICTPRKPWVHVFFVLLSVVSAGLMVLLVSQQPDWIDSPLIGSPAPPLRGTDMEGRVFDLARHRGRVVVVGFAAIGSLTSQDAMEAWNAVQTAASPQDVRVVAVCLRGSREQARRFTESAGIRYPVLVGPYDAAARGYRADITPRTVIVRPDGSIGRVFEGYHPRMVGRIGEEVRRMLAHTGGASGYALTTDH